MAKKRNKKKKVINCWKNVARVSFDDNGIVKVEKLFMCWTGTLTPEITGDKRYISYMHDMFLAAKMKGDHGSLIDFQMRKWIGSSIPKLNKDFHYGKLHINLDL